VARDRGDDCIEAPPATLADVPGQDLHLPHWPG
jgi:hypothetical protein